MKKLSLLFLIVSLAAACSSNSAKKENSATQNEVGAAALDQGAGDQAANTATGDEESTAAQASQSATPAPAPTQSKSDMYRRFNDARNAHDIKAANAAAADILARNPNDVKVLNALAVMAIEQEKYDLARLLIAKILEKEPNNSAAYNNLGVVELKTDNLRLALVNFKKATELDSGNKSAHANLGAIYLQYRNYANSVTELQFAVNNGDQSPATLSNLAFAQTGAGDYDGARNTYEKALSKDPNNVTIMLNYSALLIEHANRQKDAIKLLNKVRFVAREPAILDKAELLLKKAENPTKNTGTTEKGVSE